MLATNNIVKRKNRPAKFLALALCVAVVGAVKFAETKDKRTSPTESSRKTADWEYLIGLAVLISIVLLKFYVINYEDQQKSMDLTQKFIVNDLAEKHPELRQYLHVLKDKNTLNLITNTICNELTAEEQKEIIKTAKHASDIYQQQDVENINYKLHFLQSEIFDIVRQHAEKHPEFIFTIKNILINAHNTYFLEQKTR